MAIILSGGGIGSRKWGRLNNFRIIVHGCKGTYNKFSALTSGTFKLLAFISDTSGGQLNNETQNTVIYSASAANTIYIGTPSSPLATYSYTQNNYLASTGSAKICFAGIIGDVPSGLSISAVGGYKPIATFTESLLFGPARVVFLSLVIDVTTAASTTLIQIKKNDVLIEEQTIVTGNAYSFGRIFAMATGQYSVAQLSSGDVLNLSSSAAAGQVRFAGIILYES